MSNFRLLCCLVLACVVTSGHEQRRGDAVDLLQVGTAGIDGEDERVRRIVEAARGVAYPDGPCDERAKMAAQASSLELMEQSSRKGEGLADKAGHVAALVADAVLHDCWNHQSQKGKTALLGSWLGEQGREKIRSPSFRSCEMYSKEAAREQGRAAFNRGVGGRVGLDQAKKVAADVTKEVLAFCENERARVLPESSAEPKHSIAAAGLISASETVFQPERSVVLTARANAERECEDKARAAAEQVTVTGKTLDDATAEAASIAKRILKECLDEVDAAPQGDGVSLLQLESGAATNSDESPCRELTAEELGFLDGQRCGSVGQTCGGESDCCSRKCEGGRCMPFC